MRAHGVPNFPDPSATGGLVIPNDINTESPAFKSAQQACSNLAENGGGAGSSESRKLQLLALARCMRAHGVPNFPDPTSSPPPPSSGNVIGGNGWYLALGTAQQRQSPAYKRAAAGLPANDPLTAEHAYCRGPIDPRQTVPKKKGGGATDDSPFLLRPPSTDIPTASAASPGAEPKARGARFATATGSQLRR